MRLTDRRAQEEEEDIEVPCTIQTNSSGSVVHCTEIFPDARFSGIFKVIDTLLIFDSQF